jgi:hypothetical protein
MRLASIASFMCVPNQRFLIATLMEAFQVVLIENR